jgi:hypothetical protein
MLSTILEELSTGISPEDMLGRKSIQAQEMNRGCEEESSGIINPTPSCHAQCVGKEEGQ